METNIKGRSNNNESQPPKNQQTPQNGAQQDTLPKDFATFAQQYQDKLRDNFLLKQKDGDFDSFMSITNDEAQQTLRQIHEQYKSGKVNEQIFRGLMQLYLSMKHKLSKQLKEGLRRSVEQNLMYSLWYIFIYLTISESEVFNSYSDQVLLILFKLQEEESDDEDINSKDLSISIEEQQKQKLHKQLIQVQKYKKQKLGEMHEDFPLLKKHKKIIYLSCEELREQATRVKQMIMKMPSIPKQAGEEYFIVAIDWWKKWKEYTQYDTIEATDDSDLSPQFSNSVNLENSSNNHDTSSNSKQQKKPKHNMNQDKETLQLLYPGEINQTDGFSEMQTDLSYLKHSQQEGDIYHIKTSCKEDEHFAILPKDAFEYLIEIYDGIRVPRYSIELTTEDDEEQEEEQTIDKPESSKQEENKSSKNLKTKKQRQFMIEIFLKPVLLYILPKLRTHPNLKKPAYVFISRRAKVKKDQTTAEQLMNIARIWRLEVGENVLQIEKEFDMETRDNLPMPLSGKVLLNEEIIEEINVADNDVLLYEVQSLPYLKNNNMFAFIPKDLVQKEKRSKNSVIKSLKAEDLNEEQLMKIPLEKCMERESRGGLVGLQNLGNTCFMNSVIQCLANTEPLVKYLVYGCYEDHINKRNTLGTRGRLASVFSDLLTEMYIGTNSYVAPWDVKNVISRRAIQFQGFAQHDSQEMLSFLLETLHEDLNDVSAKPYVEYKDFDGRKDDIISTEYWEGFKKREKSLFVDLFYGQLKSRVQCTVCNKISISFDPFNMLSVPIPQTKEQKVTIKYFPYKFEEEHKEFTLVVGEQFNLREIRQKILENQSPESQCKELFLTKVKNKSAIYLLDNDRATRNNLEKGEEFCAFENPNNSDLSDNYFLIELKINQHKRSYFVMSGIQTLTYSRLLVLDKRMTVREVKLAIFKQLRFLIKTPDIPTISKERRKNMNEQKLLEEEFNWYFNNKDNQSGSFEAGNPLYSIYVNNNLPMSEGYIYSSQAECDLCNKSHKGQNCLFDFKDQMTLRQIVDKLKYDRDLELVVQFNSNPQANLKPLENLQFKQVNLSFGASNQVMKKSGISIYDCISWFSQEETLTGNDKWYCSQCKQHQNALKKMELYRAPEFLIIHLKRFSHQRASFFSSRKIQELIDFPVEGLDLRNYCLQSSSNKEQYIYDLYAVSNHYGSLNGGHYTAFAQNPINKRWYEFDDSDVSRIDSSKIATKASYVLFYRRRQKK
eukprot:403345866